MRSSALVLSAVGLWAGGCDQPAFAEVTETTHHELKVSGSPRIVVRSDAGSVDVQAGQPGLVEVEARRRAGSRAEALALAVTVQQDGGVVTIRYEGSKSNRSVAFTIQAPPGCRVDVETEGGSVRVDGFSDGVIAQTSGGSVRASHLRGAIKLHTDGGSIGVTDVDGTIDATTDGGSITLSGRLRGSNVLKTEGGSISASLPADSHLIVEGATEGGSARNDFNLPVDRRDGSAQFRGTIGTGTLGSLTMSTEGGSVSLRKM